MKAPLQLVRAAKPRSAALSYNRAEYNIRSGRREGGRLVPNRMIVDSANFAGECSAFNAAVRSAPLRSVARSNRVARTAKLVAHAAENRPHRHIDVVIGKILDPAVRAERAEVIEITLDAHDPVAEQQFPTEAGSPADSRAGCFEGLRTDLADETVVNIRKCHAALQIPHPVADGDADPRRHCCEPFHLGRPLISS